MLTLLGRAMRLPIAFGSALCVLVCGVFLSASDARADTNSVVSSRAVLLGTGYDTRSLTTRSRCVTGDVVYEGSGQTNPESLWRSVPLPELKEKLGVSERGLPNLDVLKNIGRLGLTEYAETSDTSETVTFVFEVGSRFAALSNPRLTPEAASLVGRGAATVRGICGDQFVQRVELGGALFASIRFDFHSKKDRSSFHEDMGLDSATLQNIAEKLERNAQDYKNRVEVSLRVFQVGGNPSELGRVLGSASSGQSPLPFFRCSSQEISGCQAMLLGIQDYVTHPIHGLRAQLSLEGSSYDPTKPVGAATLRFTTQGYSSVAALAGLLRESPVQQPAGVGAARTRLFNVLASLRKDASRVDRVETTRPLSRLQRQEVVAAGAAIGENMRTVQRAIDLCEAAELSVCEQAERQAATSEWKSFRMDVVENPSGFLSACLGGTASSAERKTVEAIEQYLGMRDCVRTSILLEEMDSLELVDASITDLTPLRWLGSLKRLVLRGNAITNVDALETLKALESVDVSYNSIVSLAPLRSLPRLRTIRAHGNPHFDALSAPSASILKEMWLSESDACAAARVDLLSQGAIASSEFYQRARANEAPVFVTIGRPASGISRWVPCAQGARGIR